MARTAALLVVAALALAAGPARAAGNRDEAKAHHELAKVLYSQGRFAEAEAEFQRAFDLAPLPDLLFNIGVCEEKLGHAGAAAAAYEKFLAAKPDADGAREIEEKVKRLSAEAAVERAAAPAATQPAATATKEAPPPKRSLVPIVIAVVAAVVVVGAAVGIGVALATRTPPAPFMPLEF